MPRSGGSMTAARWGRGAGSNSAADEDFFSAVTPWERGIKQALGKLTMPDLNGCVTNG